MTFSEQASSRRLQMPTGEVIDIVRSGRDNGGAAFEVEALLPPRLSGPPPHRHRREIETFEVLDGVLRVRVGNETRDLQTGESVTVSPWTLHAFANPSDRPTRIRTVETPAGQLEDQFRVMATAGRLLPLIRLARINVAHELSFHIHGIPDPIQRVLWRALATLPSRHGKLS
ncbi:cupin domain-containing protein [Pseudonocardia yunnanensis]|uniref:Cupin domain-containing protein n=1 Tax=Pseudonocardia yunnanensis TaxID=58107 RepID=A0ABW4FA28_9PSEU